MKRFFLPPEFNLASAWFADAALPLTLKQYQNIEDIVISPDDRERLRSLRRERLLFFTNHPSQAEPMVAYHIANVMGARFNFMATRRAFDFLFGAVGKFFQSLGVYSVLPGVVDRESMRMTREILSKPSGKLVIFPEGEPMCGENDNLMPFQSGFLRLGFAGLADLRKKEPDGDILILPGIVKYVIKSPPAESEKYLRKAITEIEEKLGVAPGARNLLRQFLMVGRVLLEQTEKEYGIDVPAGADFDFRIGRVRHRILDNVADMLSIKQYDKNADAIQKLRVLTSILELVEIGYEAPEVPRLTPDQLARANKECIKAYDFIVIKAAYLIANPTPERFFEWLERFRSLVMGGTPRAMGGQPHPMPRRAHVFFAPPLRLGNYYNAFQKDKSVVDSLILEIRAAMQTLLDQSQSLTAPIVTPGDLGGT